jgi:hypothetical protein
MSFRLRVPISQPVGRRLRVVLQARYSTEEQDASSIPDQFSYIRKFLADNGVTDADFEEVAEPEISGELVSRPRINYLREGIDARRWDLLVDEDTSRLFRNENACFDLFNLAFDRKVRIIAINDHVDTAEEDWDDRLHEVARHHAQANKYTAGRIKRRLTGLWEKGAAVGHIKPGHRRRPTQPATTTEPAKGPHYDELDPQWTPIIFEAYERIARNEPPWSVGLWLTEKGLPKRSNAKGIEWSGKNVIALIKNPVNRGLERYRISVVCMQRTSGKHLIVRNEPEKVLTRPMPHLRVVPDWLWHKANHAIKRRATREDTPTGLDHPLSGIPRDSRGPLSGLLVCGVCGAKMVVDGRVEGGYRCNNARSGRCWNKANPLRSVVHAQIGKAISDQMLALDGVVDAVITDVEVQLQDGGSWEIRRTKLLAEKKKLEAACEKLLDQMEGTEDPPEIRMKDRLRQRTDELEVIQAELERLEMERGLPDQLPSKAMIKEEIEQMAKRLLELDRSVRADLQRLVTPIRAVPYQQFGSSNVVLRAHFKLRLAAFLPDQLAHLLEEEGASATPAPLHEVALTVDLFELTRGPARYWKRAFELHNAGLTLEEIAERLGTNRATANRSVRYAKALVAAGLTDPFVELKDSPTLVGRWRTHARFQNVPPKNACEDGSPRDGCDHANGQGGEEPSA